jgi:SAM-dependent methyltransferase
MTEKKIVEHYNNAWSEDVVPPYIMSLYAPLQSLGISAHTKILDFGCGNGSLGAWLRNNFNCRVWGTEISDVAVTQAREKGYQEVTQHSLEDVSVPFPNESFDIAILCAAIEHLFEPDRAVQQARSSLGEKGILIVLTPNICWIVNRLLFLFGHWESALMGGTKGHIRYLNRIQLQRLLLENGFDQLDWTYSVSLVLPPNNIASIRGKAVRIPAFLVGRRVRRWQRLWAENFIVIARKKPGAI